MGILHQESKTFLGTVTTKLMKRKRMTLTFHSILMKKRGFEFLKKVLSSKLTRKMVTLNLETNSIICTVNPTVKFTRLTEL